ncbi:hypothetical protein TRFO_09025 [Tritrichomonas foetus]|uniref:Uncharacterized protein n=1 Tax=Tritrichomonas foetus TaxID=1144522 RepID=A0A1J4JKR8_9EUKA|nr:hypothetical protein TRFO_09025 [Tritrichomonas foetus]|eukprot:OHS98171.1 hypothetical protein TRFO_09025 [Tritrichomonas foetus]
MQALEQEEIAFRQMGREYAIKSELNNKEYKLKVANATNLLRTAGKREVRKVNQKDIIRSRIQTAPPKNIKSSLEKSVKKSSEKVVDKSIEKEPPSFLHTSPVQILSTEWPVRPTSAHRILSPAKLTRYKEMNEEEYKKTKDPPIIHNTGLVYSTPMKPLPKYYRPPSTPMRNND